MGKPIVYGPRYSTFTRSAIMTLLERKVAHEVVHVERATDAKQPAHLARHPFGRVPAFEHNGFMIYETVPILHYIDDAFPGVRLSPADIHRRTRSEQIMAVIGTYGYRPMVWGVAVPRCFPEVGVAVDEAEIATAAADSELVLKAIQDLTLNPDPFLVGRQVSLADMLLLPVIDYFVATPEGKAMLPKFPKLAAWHRAMQERPSVKETVPG
ncbi:glutathione S-transferase family protein [Dongia sp.]|uniref:glutathione S-transferase family protein n=1 Tax=Dongia sp. TaxID=1977262 RepID=UPI003751D833